MDRSEMPSLEERVTALETRVEELTTHGEHTNDLAVIAAREALTAREAHQKNIELLNALRKTQAEHTQRLDAIEHTLTGHGDRMDAIDGKLGQLTVGLHTIESLLRRLADEDGPGAS